MWGIVVDSGETVSSAGCSVCADVKVGTKIYTGHFFSFFLP